MNFPFIGPNYPQNLRTKLMVDTSFIISIRNEVVWFIMWIIIE